MGVPLCRHGCSLSSFSAGTLMQVKPALAEASYDGLAKQTRGRRTIMKSNNMLWRWLGFIFVLSFGALGYLGWQIYLTAPPIPSSVASASGQVLYTGEQIQKGQQVWLANGGQQQGSVWGHGAYVAPDWSADWLHREAEALQALRSKTIASDPAALTATERGALAGALREEMRRNT